MTEFLGMRVFLCFGLMASAVSLALDPGNASSNATSYHEMLREAHTAGQLNSLGYACPEGLVNCGPDCHCVPSYPDCWEEYRCPSWDDDTDGD
eukprot:CAMPEP_0197625534 /NCGR_PEP_ID=MMETSP1338-20131121/4876_1 /TAXON_ID=43686 ORGANISM="Pelagodinium beii, Strain RCC1491" /NCGR_SAMPLE_ID=MMETSP1338 /ASSEMBLY_ACC=CAM_ASM_000754 /LENGTH=92 /DNA_ID=CAMNT_0043195965 /DNA_START=50 /DNA_END=328 /DNA_ORIENTATION=-